jgi:hypothetical protein
VLQSVVHNNKIKAPNHIFQNRRAGDLRWVYTKNNKKEIKIYECTKISILFTKPEQQRLVFHKKSNRIFVLYHLCIDRKRESIDFVETKHEKRMKIVRSIVLDGK